MPCHGRGYGFEPRHSRHRFTYLGPTSSRSVLGMMFMMFSALAVVEREPRLDALCARQVLIQLRSGH